MKYFFSVLCVVLLLCGGAAALVAPFAVKKENDLIGRKVVVDGDTVTVTARRSTSQFHMSNRTVMDIRLIKELLIEEEKK